MFDLKFDIDCIIETTKDMQIAVGKKVIAFEDAAPIVQIRWFKAQLADLEKKHTPEPRKTAAAGK